MVFLFKLFREDDGKREIIQEKIVKGISFQHAVKNSKWQFQESELKLEISHYEIPIQRREVNWLKRYKGENFPY